MKLTITAFAFFTLAASTTTFAQTVQVDVNLDTVHEVGGEDTFAREKFIRFHGTLSTQQWPAVADRNSFLGDNDVYVGRATGSVTYVLSNVAQNPSYPGYAYPTDMDTYVPNFQSHFDQWAFNNAFRSPYQTIGIQKKVFPGQQLSGWSMGLNNYDALGRFYQHYLTKFYAGSSAPEKATFVEVVNEPLFMIDPTKDDYLPGLTRNDIWQGHATVANLLQSTHPDVKVGGYTTALPRWWRNDFNDWDINMKSFMDIAGEDMDFFSLHLYDLTARADDQFLRGAQNEAILDLIEAYTHIKKLENPGVTGWQSAKPFLISEYGTLGADDTFSSQEVADWENMAAFNGMLLQLLERPDKILAATPFILHYDQTRLLNADGTFTEKPAFFKLWKKVNGTRVDTWSSDPDIQVDSYVSGNTAYVAVNNLVDTSTTIDINLINGNSVSNLKMRRLYADWNNGPKYQEDIPLNPATTQVIPPYGTTVFEYTLSSNQGLPHRSTETKYYSDAYLKPIDVANANISFPVKNLSKSTTHGEAVLRLGVNREHGKSVVPSRVFVNGQEFSVPNDWKGYDQSTWGEFFGVIEIPVDYSALNTSNNSVQVRYAETGGFISSVSLQVFEQTRSISRSN